MPNSLVFSAILQQMDRSKIRETLAKFSYTNFKSELAREMAASGQSNHLIAISFAVGLCIAFSPFWGLQNILAISLAIAFSLNKVVVIMVANLSSIPPLIPVIVLTGYQSGSLIMTGDFTDKVPDVTELDLLEDNLYIYFTGALTAGITLAALSFFIVVGILTVTRNKP